MMGTPIRTRDERSAIVEHALDFLFEPLCRTCSQCTADTRLAGVGCARDGSKAK